MELAWYRLEKSKGGREGQRKCEKCLPILEGMREHGVTEPIATQRNQHWIGFGDRCGNEGERPFSDDALFLTWVNCEGLMIKITDLILNGLN